MNFIEMSGLLRKYPDIEIMRKSKGFTVSAFGSYLWSNKEADSDSKYWKYYTPSMDDILAEDWYVVKNEKLHTFEEAVVALKNGKTIQRESSISQYHIDKESGSVIGVHDVGVYKNERFLADAFNEDEALADDWVIIDK